MAISASVQTFGNTATTIHTASASEYVVVGYLFGLFVQIYKLSTSDGSTSEVATLTPEFRSIIQPLQSGDQLLAISPNGYGMVGLSVRS
jgi:hypothetical protein